MRLPDEELELDEDELDDEEELDEELDDDELDDDELDELELLDDELELEELPLEEDPPHPANRDVSTHMETLRTKRLGNSEFCKRSIFIYLTNVVMNFWM